MKFSSKRTPKGYSKNAIMSGNKINIVVARNKKGKKFSVIRINGKLAPSMATMIEKSITKKSR